MAADQSIDQRAGECSWLRSRRGYDLRRRPLLQPRQQWLLRWRHHAGYPFHRGRVWPGLLLWNGLQPINDYNIYSVVEHETDEILGTASCISTQGAGLTDYCGGSGPSAVDLFRYQAPGTLVLESTTPGAYFSYNGGATNGADGAIYNTLANSNDYADFTQNCQFVQDADGCLGSTQYITTDGGAEVNILDAVGYNQNEEPSPTPEPGR